MKLEKQVCSLELAKKLKSLGVKQESLFYWVYSLEEKASGVEKIWRVSYKNEDYSDTAIRGGAPSAFTVPELGEMLPIDFFHDSKRYFLELLTDRNETGKRKWRINYYHEVDDVIRNKYVEAETEANARAKMLIYLIENKLVNL